MGMVFFQAHFTHPNWIGKSFEPSTSITLGSTYFKMWIFQGVRVYKNQLNQTNRDFGGPKNGVGKFEASFGADWMDDFARYRGSQKTLEDENGAFKIEDTVDGSEIPRTTTWDVENLVNNNGTFTTCCRISSINSTSWKSSCLHSLN